MARESPNDKTKPQGQDKAPMTREKSKFCLAPRNLHENADFWGRLCPFRGQGYYIIK